MGAVIICQDVLEWARAYRGEPFHALLTDPPYEMGLLNQGWDKTGIAFRPETWAALGEHLYPGGFGLAFASARGAHRLACAIEDAGFIIHPAIFGWSFGGGMPKATAFDDRIDDDAGRGGASALELKTALRALFEQSGLTLKALNQQCGFEASGYLRAASTWAYVLPPEEKWQVMKTVLQAGDDLDAMFRRAQREVVGQARWTNSAHHFVPGADHTQRVRREIAAPLTGLAAAWQGHRYGLGALKPAFEPVVLFQKPYSGKPLENIEGSGAGALNIDATRVQGAKGGCCWGSSNQTCKSTFNSSPNTHEYRSEMNASGRWPANLVLQHTPDCRRVGDARVRGGDGGQHSGGKGTRVVGAYGHDRTRITRYADEDGMETVEQWECAPGCPIAALDRQSGITKSGAMKHEVPGYAGESVTGFLRGRSGPSNQHGDEGGASRFFYRADWAAEIAEQLVAADPVAYRPKPSRQEKDAGPDGRNPRPTVKPISLARWLATLLLPPGEYAPRRLLVPFAGSGTEVIGALQAGWDEVAAIELSAEYAHLIEARCRNWMEKETG